MRESLYNTHLFENILNNRLLLVHLLYKDSLTKYLIDLNWVCSWPPVSNLGLSFHYHWKVMPRRINIRCSYIYIYTHLTIYYNFII
jgi:hypothetical protein